MMTDVRDLLVVLGDQLDRESPLLLEGDRQHDRVWMAEVREEATHVPSHKARIALFLAAMRHYRDWLRDQGWQLQYEETPESSDLEPSSLASALAAAIERWRPNRVRVVLPGDHRVLCSLQATVERYGLTLDIVEDPSFFDTPEGFRQWAAGRKQLRLEYYYRALRQRHGILLDGEQPVGGRWNYDAENRESFGKAGPGSLPAPRRFPPDAVTGAVLALVERNYADHPGSLAQFDWPVTPEQALAALDDFIAHRLADFGRYQDAVWAGEPWLYHSRLSAAMNLKLLAPRTVVARVEDAWRSGRVPLPAAEGFIRQVLGWREYVRGLYWKEMPEYQTRNALDAQARLPDFFWTAQTDMACLRDTLEQTLAYGYAHHIQRLMFTGLYTLLLGVQPEQVHRWYLSVYVDAVEWVELPNTLGMSQYADGGIMASKPYCASGKYIDRMSNHCKACRYRPELRTGPRACPFTTLYWDFLLKHRQRLGGNARMRMQLRNLERLTEEEVAAIQEQARRHRQQVGAET